MWCMKRAAIAALVLCGLAFGQADAPKENPKLMFDVASVKLSQPSGPQRITRMIGGPGTKDPAQVHWENVPLQFILQAAYGLKNQRQILAEKDPSVLATYYDITANVPMGTTKEQFNVMIQNLLLERLKLVAHRETRPIPVYQLVVAKGGLKMKGSATTPGKPLEAAPASNGFPAISGGLPAAWTRTPDGHFLFRARSLPISCEPVRTPSCDLFMTIVLIGNVPGFRIIEDKAGLTGTYDFTLDFVIGRQAGPTVADDGRDGPNIFDALEQQLGLKLVDTKEPMDVLVVERVEKPVEN